MPKPINTLEDRLANVSSWEFDKATNSCKSCKQTDEEKYAEAQNLILQDLLGLLPEKVPSGPTDPNPDATNSIPWEAGHNQAIDQMETAIRNYVNGGK